MAYSWQGTQPQPDPWLSWRHYWTSPRRCFGDTSFKLCAAQSKEIGTDKVVLVLGLSRETVRSRCLLPFKVGSPSHTA